MAGKLVFLILAAHPVPQPLLSFPKASPPSNWEQPGLLLGIPDMWEFKTMRGEFRTTDTYRVPRISRIGSLHVTGAYLEPRAVGRRKRPLIRLPASHIYWSVHIWLA